eukprot:9466901-Pyramimonas_sp.AAC.1
MSQGFCHGTVHKCRLRIQGFPRDPMKMHRRILRVPREIRSGSARIPRAFFGISEGPLRITRVSPGIH